MSSLFEGRRRAVLRVAAALVIALALCSTTCTWSASRGEVPVAQLPAEPPLSEPLPEPALEPRLERAKGAAETAGPPRSPADPATEPLGTFRVTAYCSCRRCCGKWALLPEGERPPIRGPYCAADLSVLPRGSKVCIEGVGWRTVSDTGRAMVGRRIDLLMSSHAEARRFGKRWLRVERAEERSAGPVTPPSGGQVQG
jgi:3D (Asp-Asp-Asp) domain-containing protein